MTRLGEIGFRAWCHIFDGDLNGGGHGFHCEPGKSRFPDWSERELRDAIKHVAIKPQHTPIWTKEQPGWECRRVVNGVEMVVVINTDGSVRTSYPETDHGQISQGVE